MSCHSLASGPCCSSSSSSRFGRLPPVGVGGRGGGGGGGRPQPPPPYRGGRENANRGSGSFGSRGIDGRPPSHVFNREEYRQTNSGLFIPSPRDRSNEPVPVPGSQDLLGLSNDPEAQALASSVIAIKPPSEVDDGDQCTSDEERIMMLQRRAGPWYVARPDGGN